jgi:formate dehydrogenase major subunit
MITDRVAAGVVYTTFHYTETRANVVTTENSDWKTNCPEYKVTAVSVKPISEKRAGVLRSEYAAAEASPSGK